MGDAIADILDYDCDEKITSDWEEFSDEEEKLTKILKTKNEDVPSLAQPEDPPARNDVQPTKLFEVDNTVLQSDNLLPIASKTKDNNEIPKNKVPKHCIISCKASNDQIQKKKKRKRKRDCDIHPVGRKIKKIEGIHRKKSCTRWMQKRCQKPYYVCDFGNSNLHSSSSIDLSGLPNKLEGLTSKLLPINCNIVQENDIHTECIKFQYYIKCLIDTFHSALQKQLPCNQCAYPFSSSFSNTAQPSKSCAAASNNESRGNGTGGVWNNHASNEPNMFCHPNNNNFVLNNDLHHGNNKYNTYCNERSQFMYFDMSNANGLSTGGIRNNVQNTNRNGFCEHLEFLKMSEEKEKMAARLRRFANYGTISSISGREGISQTKLCQCMPFNCENIVRGKDRQGMWESNEPRVE